MYDIQAILTVALGALTIILGFFAANYATKWAQVKAVIKAIAELTQEFGDMATEVDKALVDDAVSEAEFAKIYNEFKETREKFFALVLAVKALFSF